MKLILKATDIRPHIKSTIQKTITYNAIERMSILMFNKFIIDFLIECEQDYHHFHEVDFTLSNYVNSNVEREEYHCSINKDKLIAMSINESCYFAILMKLMWD